MGFIYKLTYKKTRKAYIGQTLRDIEERLKEHQLPSSGCRAISGAIKKHGWENFDKEWYEVPDEDLNFYEEMLVALLGTLSPSGYNLKDGGGNGKLSEETKQKIGKGNSGKMRTEEVKQKISEAKLGKTHTKEIRQNMSKAHLGIIHTEETKQKIAKANIGKILSEETKKKLSIAKQGKNNCTSKRVYQYDTSGNFITSFASSGEAARFLGRKDGTCISSCARGDLNTAYGFKWSRE
ncbi:GIY-YIG catalytic domain-containing endonuclease [Paramecium bursaria Chlorella virus Can18-4]|nr:GIY-YIG catalytic domain-containing endonuclease [Paramecium bursaria Chlorella virus Can18-4]